MYGKGIRMKKDDVRYEAYVNILKRELVPAMGCTEPVAIAYCAAKARETLGTLPTRMKVAASGNIIKNVKSVIVPNTGGQRGIGAAAAAGALYGDATAKLEVIAHVEREQIAELADYIEKTPIELEHMESDHVLDMIVTVTNGTHSALVQIANEHTNIIRIEKDGELVFSKEDSPKEDRSETDAKEAEYELLDVIGIVDFAETCDVADVKEILDRQIAYNTAISEEGLRGSYGANIGKVLLEHFGDSVYIRARAKAAAGSDARMNGCELPVVINSGSGNQGMTVSIPVLEYAKEFGASQEKTYRALLISNLVTLHEQSGIGRLSAYCGAVSAGAGAGAAIAWLSTDGDLEAVEHTIVNALAITSGIVCDGAKSSCAAKISAAVDAGIIGYEMFASGQQFYGGDGLVAKGVENSINNFSRLGRIGMKETDKEIIEMMTKN